MRFPVFVQAEAEVELRLALKPGDVCPDFGGFQMTIVTVQILAVGILAPVQNEAHRIQARAKPKFGVFRPLVFPEQAQRGERSGRFVAVDAGAEVNPG